MSEKINNGPENYPPHTEVGINEWAFLPIEASGTIGTGGAFPCTVFTIATPKGVYLGHYIDLNYLSNDEEYRKTHSEFMPIEEMMGNISKRLTDEDKRKSKVWINGGSTSERWSDEEDAVCEYDIRHLKDLFEATGFPVSEDQIQRREPNTTLDELVLRSDGTVVSFDLRDYYPDDD